MLFNSLTIFMKGKIMKKLTQDLAIMRCKELRGNRYDYSKSIYKDYHSPIEIICKNHGSFFQGYCDHLKGNNCPVCCNESRSIKHSYTLKEIIDKANQIHNNRYDYSLITNYTHSERECPIICPDHGVFIQKMSGHLCNHGCPICGGSKLLDTKEFIKKSRLVHGRKYSYSKVKYINGKTKVIITCKDHGDFKQEPTSHLQGRGCPVCRCSYGERIVSRILEEKHIEFIPQKSFPNCKYKRVLYFDFYIPSKNACIEYDGQQHFEPRKRYGSIEGLKYIELKDEIKIKYCEDNNITLIRIPYWLPIEDIKDILINDLQLF